MLAKFVLLLSVSAVFLDAKATPNVTSTYNFYRKCSHIISCSDYYMRLKFHLFYQLIKFIAATKWAWRNISYSIHGYPMNQTEITPKIFEQVVKKAFDVSNDENLLNLTNQTNILYSQAWEEVADIHFYRIKDGQKANIPVSFEQQQHGGKGHPGFRNESIAHGKWPNDSYVHLNENRNWTLSPATYGTLFVCNKEFKHSTYLALHLHQWPMGHPYAT